MDLHNIKRNSLDIILTDLLPNELSELYTNRYFYDFLLKNEKKLKIASKKLLQYKNNNQKLFDGGTYWASAPLKFKVTKPDMSLRDISIIQPIAALQVYEFITLYQKEILSLLNRGSSFSIRYHHKNNDLYYKGSDNKLTAYFEQTKSDVNRSVIQQSNAYFKIGPYQSIISFTKSHEWFINCRKFNYIAKIDYQSCFDNIYSHTYKWLIGKDVNDTKDFSNSNVFTTIDRVLQNINARTSNGIIVGPEFSRMIAEILLQGIDENVQNLLQMNGYVKNEHYSVYRYVDDIYIFGINQEVIDHIITCFNDCANKYMLHFNESKMRKEKTPFILNTWFKNTSEYSSKVKGILFYTNREIKLYKENHKDKETYGFKNKLFQESKSNMMEKFGILICENKGNEKIIVRYTLGTLLNGIQKIKGNCKLFSPIKRDNCIRQFMEFILFIYSFAPDYNNTQRLIAIINYINDEYDILENRDVFQEIITSHSYIIEKANINEIVNLIILFASFKFELPYKEEKYIQNWLESEENPIMWASYLLYSKYNEAYFKEICDYIENKITTSIQSIIKKNYVLTYKEIWWIYIFNKCDYIKPATQDIINDFINNYLKALYSDDAKPSEICMSLLYDFMIQSDKQFFQWDLENKDFLKEVTFKTYERTIFKNYNLKYAFMEFSSID